MTGGGNCLLLKQTSVILNKIKALIFTQKQFNHLIKNKNSLISFLVLGIPFFIEFFIFLKYHELNYETKVIPPYYTMNQIIELFAIFSSLYILFVSTNSNFIKKLSLILWLLILYIPTNLELIAVHVTDRLLSNDFMFTIFNTHLEETLLVLKEYSFFIIVNLAIIGFSFKLKSKNHLINKKYSIFAVILVLCSIFLASHQPFNRILNGFFCHINDLKDLDQINKMKFPIKGIQSQSALKPEKETYVFVIGESVDRKHMGIYGYERQTTPCFEKLKNELFVFNNVTTAHVFTSEAVKSTLLIKDGSNQIFSLIQFFKGAGFKTFWFSNQGKSEKFDNTIMRFGKTCNEYAFIHGEAPIYSSETYNITFKNESRRLNLWDENLLKYFEQALNDKFPKKLIVIHLKGSHTPIDLRYPPEFKKFSLPPKYYDRIKALGTCLFDNSILYTDHILNQIITLLKQKNEVSAMLYLSDHGQDINDTKECILAARTYPNAYDVPFIVWVSNKYHQNNSKFISNWNLNQKYVTDKTSYSLIDLARLSHPSFDMSNSIFSKK